MPTSLTCDMCGDEAAVSMMTSLANGDSLAVGQACQLTFHLTLAAELIKAMPAELTAAYDEAANTLLGALAQSRAGSDGLLPADLIVTSDESGSTIRDANDGSLLNISPKPAGADQQPAPAEGTPDDNTAPRQDDPAADPAGGAPADGPAHRPRGGHPRRPG